VGITTAGDIYEPSISPAVSLFKQWNGMGRALRAG